MAASIEDVAKRAGVSIATVSRSLRGLPDVAASTRDRVLVAARELEYVASPFAARLASGRTATVGVVVPFVDRWFFAQVLGAVESVLRTGGYDLLLYNLADAAGRDRFFTEMPVRKRVDALVLASLEPTVAETEALRALRLPVGLIGVRQPGFVSTRIDDEQAAGLATRHLLERGHRRIALIGGDMHDPMGFTPPLHRRIGYRAALAEAGIEADPGLELTGYFTVEGGAQAMARLLTAPDAPTAVFAESDEMAYGALRTLRRAGRRVPQDVAVVGFDDHADAELFDLTTVRQPVVAQGVDVAERVLEVVAGGGSSASEDVVLPVELVVRGSTDPDAGVYSAG